jgi:hypothetical protein
MNRQAAVSALKDTINVEGSREAEWQHRTKPNNSFNRSGINLNVIENLDAARQFFPPG